ncbi:MAG: ABC transporter permease, partial [Flavisolibacter sp.]
MIFLFIINELNYDSFHKNGKDIYRVMRTGNVNGEEREIPYLSPAYATALKNDYPDAIKQAVRVMPDNDLISYKNIAYNEKNIYVTDSNFFQVFDFALIHGSAATVLKEPNSIVLTETTAKKYFADEDPVGKVLQLNKNQQLKVTGVCKDVPVNSHLRFDMVISISTLRSVVAPDWYTQFPSNNLFTYVQLNPSVDPALLKNRFPAFMDKYLGQYYAKNGFKMGLTIKPLKDIYFASDGFDNVKHG